MLKHCAILSLLFFWLATAYGRALRRRSADAQRILARRRHRARQPIRNGIKPERPTLIFLSELSNVVERSSARRT